MPLDQKQKNAVQRFLDAYSTGTSLHDSVEPTPMTGKSVSNIEHRTESATESKRHDDGLGTRTAYIIETKSFSGLFNIQDPGIFDVGSSVSTSFLDQKTVYVHYGIPAGSTSFTIGSDYDDLSKLYRFYQITDATVAPAESGMVVEVEMVGVNYGKVINVPDNASNRQARIDANQRKAPYDRNKFKNPKPGQPWGPPPAIVPGIENDKSFDGPGPELPEERKKVHILMRKLDRTDQFPIINNKFGTVPVAEGSRNIRTRYRDYDEGKQYLEKRVNSMETEMRPVQIPLKNYLDEQMYKIKTKIGPDYDNDLIEQRWYNPNGNLILAANIPQPVCGTERTVKAIIKIEQIWSALRLRALKAGQEDPGAWSETMFNGYRSRQVNLYRSLEPSQVKSIEKKGYWEHQKTKYYPDKRLNRFDHSHTLGTAFDISIHNDFGGQAAKCSGPLKARRVRNFKRLTAILARIVWAADFDQSATFKFKNYKGKLKDYSNTSLIGFGWGLYHYHLGLRYPKLTRGGPYTHWVYPSGEVDSYVPQEWHNKPGNRKKYGYPSFEKMVNLGLEDVSNEIKLDYPEWDAVFKEFNAWPIEFNK